MKVRREQLVETERFMIGDRISVELAGFGTFSATAQRVLPEGTLFLFDKCICEMPMNELPTSAGGYERTPLAAFLRSQVLDAFPAELRPRVRELTLPTYGQIFGHDEGYDEYYMPDQDQQFPLMAELRSRISCVFFDGADSICWYWLQNAVLEEISPSLFAHTDRQGRPGAGRSSATRGVRPLFLLAR